MEKISLSDLLSQVSVALDAVEADLAGAAPYHSKRTAVYCLAIGRYLGYDVNRLFALGGSALLHDNALTEYILSESPGQGRELNLKSHCILGEENARNFPFPAPINGYILYHHELMNGKGAFGKKGDEFPEEAEIIGLADRIDVNLVMRKSSGGEIDKISEYIKARMGKEYSQRVCAAALAVLNHDLLDGMSDENIHGTLQRGMPDVEEWIREWDLIGISGIIARIIDYKSNFTKLHSIQIANKAWYMGGIYHYSDSERVKLYVAAAFHDVGKLFIPSSILEKPGKLTEEEFQIIKSHAGCTWRLLKNIRGFEEIAVWASEHHEKLDGTGYPLGKSKEELCFNSRLLACLDIYQAVREARPYHPERGHADTIRILYQMAEAGVIDPVITADLDRELAKLDSGAANPPDKTELCGK